MDIYDIIAICRENNANLCEAITGGYKSPASAAKRMREYLNSKHPGTGNWYISVALSNNVYTETCDF